MPHIHTHFIGKTEFEKLTLCGNTIMYQLKNEEGAFTFPFEVKETEGLHDYKSCTTCQQSLKKYTKELQDRFTGKKQKKAFPNCCKYHKNLLKIKDFDITKFQDVPEQTAKKIIYTTQHITNNKDNEHWYKKITDYIEWTAFSFGQMPKDCGEPLYLGTYLSCIENYIKKESQIETKKGSQILKFIKKYRNPTIKSKSEFDLKTLIETYERWLDMFPFEISFINNLKPKFESQFPLVSEIKDTNLYSGMTSFSMHTKKSLIKLLVPLTKQLLDSITDQIPQLRKNNLITNAQSISLELQDAQLIRETAEITRQFTKGELKYLKALKRWLRIHKNYFKELEPIFLNKNITSLNDSQTPKDIINKTITLKDDNTITLVFDLLKNFFTTEEHLELKKALGGTNVSTKLYFPHNSNKFVEFFRRLKYNGYVINTPTELRSWICSNFCYLHSRTRDISDFNEDSVWDILSKGKSIPNKNSRICDVEWLTFKTQNQLNRERKEEKLK